MNVGRLFRGEPWLISCTPHGVIQILLRSGIDPAGKHAVVCGRSNLVGKPLVGLLMQKGRRQRDGDRLPHGDAATSRSTRGRRTS